MQFNSRDSKSLINIKFVTTLIKFDKKPDFKKKF